MNLNEPYTLVSVDWGGSSCGVAILTIEDGKAKVKSYTVKSDRQDENGQRLRGKKKVVNMVQKVSEVLPKEFNKLYFEGANFGNLNLRTQRLYTLGQGYLAGFNHLNIDDLEWIQPFEWRSESGYYTNFHGKKRLKDVAKQVAKTWGYKVTSDDEAEALIILYVATKRELGETYGKLISNEV